MADEIKLLEVDVAGLAKSIQNAKVELDSLRIALDATTEAEGKNSEATTIAKAAYDAQNKSVKQLEGALLRVTQAEQALGANIQDIVKGYDASNKSVDQNRKVLNALTAEYNKLGKEGREKLAPSIKQISDELKKQEGAIGDNRRNVGNYKEAFVGAFSEISKGVPVFGQLQTAQQGVNAIMSANPIGGVVTLLTALFQIMQNNAQVADQVSFAFAGVNKFFGNIIDTVVDTVSSFDKLTTALKHPIDFIFNLGKNAATAAKEGFQAAQAFDDLTEKQAELNGLADISRSKAEGLAKTLKDRTKSEKERIKIAEQVANLEIDALNKLQQAKQAELDATNLQNKGRKLSGEERAKVIKLQLEVEQLAEEKNTAEKQKQTRINILLDKQVTEAKKKETKSREEIERERQEQVRKTFDNERTLREFRLNQEADSLDKRLKLFDLNSEQQEQKLREAGATEIEITEWRNKEVKAITDKYNQEQLDATKQTEKGKQDAQQETVDKAKENTSLLTDDVKKQVNDVGAIISGVVGLIGAIGDNLMQQSEQNIQALEAQKEAGLITQNEFDKRAKQEKEKAFKEAKALNIVMAVMNTANAVIAQLSNPTPYVGIALAALAAATGAAQIAIIAKQQPPKFAEGGSVFDVGGKPHSSGGTKYVGEDGNRFEVERGEKIFVMKATASKYIDALGGVNMMFGGRSWSNSSVRFAAQGGAIQDGGFVARNTTQRADELATQKALISTLLKSMPAPVVSVQEINKVNNGRNKSVAVSEL